MATSVKTKPIADSIDVQPVTITRVLHSEWIKMRTLRSSWAILMGSVFAMIAFGLLVAFNTRHLSAKLQANDLSKSAVMQGYYLCQLLVGTFGVIFVSGEYNTGQIKSTFSAVPKRLYILISKTLLLTGVILSLMAIACVIAFVSGQALIGHFRIGYSLFDTTSLRVVFGTALYLTLIGLLGSSIGWIVRNTPGALVTFFALLLVLPELLGVALGSFGKQIVQFFPANAGGAFLSIPPEPNSLKPWAGLIALLAWVVVALIIAAFALRKRDV